MKTEHTLSPEESLSLIADTISRTRRNISDNSFCFLLWGWLIALASVSFYFLQQFTSFTYYFIVFPVLAVPGIVITLAYFRKRQFTSTETFLDDFLGKMWLVLGAGFLTVVFITVSQGGLPFVYTLLIAGLGTLISGLTLRFKPLVIGGIVLLASAILSIYVNDQYKSLVHGFAIITGYLIPGYLLKSSAVK